MLKKRLNCFTKLFLTHLFNFVHLFLIGKLQQQITVLCRDKCCL